MSARILYLDPIGGISGDMTVGALLALGVRLELLRAGLRRMRLDGCAVDAAARRIGAISATRFRVEVTGAGRAGHGDARVRPHPHVTHAEIRRLIGQSELLPPVRDTALAIFARLAAAEARVHGIDPEAVTFHEVGAIDSIVDIVCCAIGVHALGITRAHVGPIPLGSGMVHSAHGPLPVPAPATVALLEGFPVRFGVGDGELVTPTGAAIVAALATPGPPPTLRITAVGYGAGERELADRPNVLRAVLGEADGPPGTLEHLLVLEATLDDLAPEVCGYVLERLLEAGARDVHFTPVHMKKNRPGVVLSVLSTEDRRDTLAGIVLTETSSLGVRFHAVTRIALPRRIEEVVTRYGTVRVKVATLPDGSERAAPEYEDCRQRAREHGVPLRCVYEAALVSALTRRPG